MTALIQGWGSMRSYVSGFLIVGIVVVFAGCGEPPKGGPRVEVFPVSGEVFVGGEPAKGAFVNLHTAGAAVPSSGQVDESGKFEIATYGQADGAPVGTYKLTVTWPAPQGISGRLDGPDRLNGRYSDPAKSTFEVQVVDAPVSVPRLELTAK